MVATPPPVSLYVTRWKPFLAVLIFAGGIVIDLLHYFVWPTPTTTVHPWEYQEPAKTILFVVVLLGCATFVGLGLYWTLTPRPLLQLSTTQLVYRPFPLRTRTILWEDVENVTAGVARQATSAWTRATILTFWFSLRSDRFAPGSDDQHLSLDINLGHLSLQADDLVQLVRTYHPVQWLHKHPGAAAEQRGHTPDASPPRTRVPALPRARRQAPR
jgi:hypothetical protein